MSEYNPRYPQDNIKDGYQNNNVQSNQEYGQINGYGNTQNGYSVSSDSDTLLTRYMSKVYMMMTVALILSAASAYICANSNTLTTYILESSIGFYGLIIAEFALVWIMGQKMLSVSVGTLTMMFVTYSIINGLTLGVIFSVYSKDAITGAFLTSALTFGVCSVIGMTVKKDLSAMGQFLLYGLIGIIIASIINFFFASSIVYWVTTYAGVVIFLGLTVYDTWKLKNMGYHLYDEETSQKLAVMGALSLYLDFVNLFLYILRLFHSKD